LRKASWGKGYATEGAKALILKSFSELETQHIVAVALAANVVSIRVMEKVGLKLERRMMYEPLGQEIVMYALRRDEFQPENYATT
jgi:RimJ/RimL family protein N-acetyltransferase